MENNLVKFVITTDEGVHYKASTYSDSEVQDVKEGVITIIRLNDGKELNRDGQWEDLVKWN